MWAQSVNLRPSHRQRVEQVIRDVRFDATNMQTLGDLPEHMVDDLEATALRFHGAVLRASMHENEVEILS